MTPKKNGMYLYNFLCVNGPAEHTHLIFPVTFKITTVRLVLFGTSDLRLSNGWLGLEEQSQAGRLRRLRLKPFPRHSELTSQPNQHRHFVFTSKRGLFFLFFFLN